MPFFLGEGVLDWWYIEVEIYRIGKAMKLQWQSKISYDISSKVLDESFIVDSTYTSNNMTYRLKYS